MSSLYTGPSAIFAIIVMVGGGSLSADETANSMEFEESKTVEQTATLNDPALTESSGLAFSGRIRNRLWSHNDSGGSPRLYAFDTSGRKTGHVDLPVRMVDWEDIAAFSDHGTPRLLVADSGDNRAIRRSVTLYLVNEPDPDAETEIDRVQTIDVTYPNGPGDCEAIAVDVYHRKIVMIAKTIFAPATVYTVPLPLPIEGSDAESSLQTSVTANQIKRLVLPLITGMDIDPATGALWVTSYFQAFRFPSKRPDRSLAILFDQKPDPHQLPRWKQIEAIAVDPNRHVWVTSEGKPAKLGRLKPSELPTASGKR